MLDVSALSSNLTLACNQTLSGRGIVNGNVTIGRGAVLAPSNLFGTLTFSNALTLASGSVCVMEVGHAPTTNDIVRVLGTLTYGGSLLVSNITANPLAAGDAFTLFNAAGYAGGFSQISPPIPGPSLVWDASGLASNGVLRVLVGSSPHFTAIKQTGGNLLISGTGGSAGAPYYVLTTTNSLLPPALWIRILTNYFETGGNFTFTNTMNSSAPANFYVLQVP